VFNIGKKKCFQPRIHLSFLIQKRHSFVKQFFGFINPSDNSYASPSLAKEDVLNFGGMLPLSARLGLILVKLDAMRISTVLLTVVFAVIVLCGPA